MNDLLRITEIRILGLFGLYDHIVPLSTKDRVTIIHGPNGIGKTALLRLVNNFVLGNFLSMYTVPFKTFELTLSDGTKVGIKRNIRGIDNSTDLLGEDEDTVIAPNSNISFFKKTPKEKELTETITGAKLDIRGTLNRIDRESPWIARVAADRWVDRRNDFYFTTEELLTNYAHELSPNVKKKLFSEPEWLAETRKKINVHLIETQRLLRIQTASQNSTWRHSSQPEPVVSTVKNYAKELQEKVTKALAEYAKASQSLDQSFPQRLLSGMMQPLNADELKKRMNQIEEKRSEFQRIGLLDEDTAYPFDVKTLERLDPAQHTVMTLYVDDTAQKLGILNDLSERVKLLLDNLNKKYRNKRIQIDKKNGLVAKDKNGNTLNLDMLSSGEQHELVLVYDLLFRVVPNTMVLIDEPELSLHISWQKVFLSDLLQIVHTANFDVLAATHSPFIAGERDDLMIALASNEENK